ncbi:LacI family DNA-binding transcriptional regulator [Streptomyces sp. NRRL F-5630]|uniref:LacI family DNA-binding transcriptional regulator n=1 Tax=Streptomyces sp. NRRL F-5630 TaxID=1463864 RepID=UPI003D71CD81
MGRRPGGRVTFRAIADEAGVSIATVSRVVNGSTRVSEGTQRAVREAAQRLGSGFARTRGGAPPVLVYCPYALTDYFGTIVTSVVETLALHGRRALVLAGESAQDDTSALLALPEQQGIAGAVLVLPPGSTHDLEVLHARRYPLVVVDPRAELPETVASVSAAHAAGARRVTRHLLGLGHRRIGFIGGPGDWLASRNRLVGHTAALGESRLLPDPALLAAITEPTTHEGHTAARLLLSRDPRPTALVAFNDKTAAGAIRAAREAGLTVPGDLSVTGFDDSELGQSITPALTTVRQPLEEMGRMAVSLLVRLVAGHAVDTLHVELATPLVVRDSTAPPSAACRV